MRLQQLASLLICIGAASAAPAGTLEEAKSTVTINKASSTGVVSGTADWWYESTSTSSPKYTFTSNESPSTTTPTYSWLPPPHLPFLPTQHSPVDTSAPTPSPAGTSSACSHFTRPTKVPSPTEGVHIPEDDDDEDLDDLVDEVLDILDELENDDNLEDYPTIGGPENHRYNTDDDFYHLWPGTDDQEGDDHSVHLQPWPPVHSDDDDDEAGAVVSEQAGDADDEGSENPTPDDDFFDLWPGTKDDDEPTVNVTATDA